MNADFIKIIIATYIDKLKISNPILLLIISLFVIVAYTGLYYYFVLTGTAVDEKSTVGFILGILSTLTGILLQGRSNKIVNDSNLLDKGGE